MEQGWWNNYGTGKLFVIDEHERWIRRGKNSIKLEVPSTIRRPIHNHKEVDRRDKLILDLIKIDSHMRISGLGSYATFEFSSESLTEPLQLILKWGLHNAGSHLGLKIVKSGKKKSIFALHFVLYKNFKIKLRSR